MQRKLLWALVGILIAVPIIVALVGTKILQFQAMAEAGAQFVMPPEPVNVELVRDIQWQPRISSVGSVAAIQGTVISTETEGVVRTINFRPGARVNAGDVLVEMDKEVELAQLEAAEVDVQWARLNYKRAQELSKSRNISEAELDSAANSVKQAEAQLKYLRTLLEKKTVRAPFAGKLGILEISVGRFLPKGSPVVSLQSIDPIFVEFSLPQQYLGELTEGLEVIVTADSYPEKQFDGTITAINSSVDRDTRNVRVQATLDNPEGYLRPGMFVSLDVVTERTEKALMIPATAVQHGPRGNTVFIVEEAKADPEAEEATADKGKNLVVRQQAVTLGERMGDFVVVIEGVKSGEQVVSTGVFKLRPGMAVVIDNSLAPEFSLAPTPKNT